MLVVVFAGVWRAPAQEPLVPAGAKAAAAPPASPATAGPGDPAAAVLPEGESRLPATGAAVPPDTFLLRDSKGNLVPVLGMPFEEFEQLLKAKKGLAPQAPPYSLDALSASGSVAEGIANLQITLTIRPTEPGVTIVPLRLGSAVMRAAPRHEGPGEHFLYFDGTAGGFASCLKVTDRQPHVITLQASFPVVANGEEKRLQLALPRATESSLRLSIPGGPLEEWLGSGEGILTSEARATGRTEITVLGAGGDLQLVWRPERPAASGRATLDASGQIRVRVESEHRITSDALIRVRNFSGPMSTFQVRLPPHFELLPVAEAGYTVSAVDSPGTSSAQGLLVEIRGEKPAAVFDVHLLAALAPEAAPETVQPARFEVLDAVRQRGTIEFSSEGEWQIDWTEDESVRRLDPGTGASADRQAARFDYFRQPCGLTLRVAPRPSRVSVEPAYRVDVTGQQLRLEATLKYRFRGARSAGLALEMSGWTFVRISPDDVVDLPLLKTYAQGRLFVPFRAPAAVPAELELRLEAYQPWDGNADQVTFNLPRAVADVVVPATVAITPADHLELVPLLGELVGLTPESASVRVAGRQQPALVLRDLGGGAPAKFSGIVRRLARVVTASGRATVRMESAHLEVEQRIEYRIAHEPQRHFALLIPAAIAQTGSLQAYWNGEPRPLQPIEGTARAAGDGVRMQFAAPSDQIGACAVSLRYQVPLPASELAAARPLALPLPVPEMEGTFHFTGQQVEFALPAGWQIEPAVLEDDLVRSGTAGGAVQSFAWTEPLDVTRWLVQTSGVPSATTVVNKFWLQTWLAPEVRQDTLLLRLLTSQASVDIRLPEGARPAGPQVLVDGQPAPAQWSRETQVLRAELPPSARGRECLVELVYTAPPPPVSLGVVRDKLAAAQVLSSAPPRRGYWQVILPENEYLAASPGDLPAEMAWDWNRLPVQRRPVLSEAELEAWMQADPREAAPAAANVYLFGVLGKEPVLSLVALHRRLLIYGASGGLLAAGLLLLHVPWLRQPSLLLLAAVGLAALGLSWPDLAVLAAQWSLLGGGVLLLTVLWVWLASGRTPLAAVRQPGSVIVRAADSHASRPPSTPPKRGSQITTTAAAAPLEVSQ